MAKKRKKVQAVAPKKTEKDRNHLVLKVDVTKRKMTKEELKQFLRNGGGFHKTAKGRGSYNRKKEKKL